MLFIEEPSWFSVGQTAESLTSSIMDKPHTGLDDCLRILLSCFREKMSDNKPLHGVGQKDNNTFWENLSLLRDSRKFRRHGQVAEADLREGQVPTAKIQSCDKHFSKRKRSLGTRTRHPKSKARQYDSQTLPGCIRSLHRFFSQVCGS